MHTWIYESQNLTLGGIIIKREGQEWGSKKKKKKEEVKKIENNGLITF
jgi:hypothetical protein